MNPEHVAWCRRTFDMVKDGGIWAMPRSGLVFQKTGPAQFTLINQMPWMAGMPINAEELAIQQEIDFDLTVRHFAAAGIEVIKKDTHHAS